MRRSRSERRGSQVARPRFSWGNEYLAIVLRLLAVLTLLAGLVMSASPVAAGEEALEPTAAQADP
jgi:hypothetical protein